MGGVIKAFIVGEGGVLLLAFGGVGQGCVHFISEAGERRQLVIDELTSCRVLSVVFRHLRS